MWNSQIAYETLQEVAELTSDAVILLDLREGRFLHVNEAFYKLVDVDEQAFQACTFTQLLDLVVSDDKELIHRQVQLLLEKKAVRDIEFRILNVDGNTVVVCGSAYLLSNKTIALITLKNTTQPKVHEDYIVEFGARKNTMLDNLTHQISGALNMMRDLSSQASKRVGSDSDHQLRIYLKLLSDNINYCLDIINDLMRREHEQSPFISVKITRIDLVAKVKIIYSELVDTYRSRTFLFNCDCEKLFVKTDEVKFLQVINNLVSNSLKFSNESTPITFSITDKQDCAVISVSDSGIGIPDEWHSLIFVRNSGVGRVGLKGEPSVGIGLSICKHLVELCSGEISFESIEGKGTTFFVTIPKA